MACLKAQLIAYELKIGIDLFSYFFSLLILGLWSCDMFADNVIEIVLMNLKFLTLKFCLFLDSDDRSLTEVFRLFDLIHIVTTDHKIITRITKEVRELSSSSNF